MDERIQVLEFHYIKHVLLKQTLQPKTEQEMNIIQIKTLKSYPILNCLEFERKEKKISLKQKQENNLNLLDWANCSNVPKHLFIPIFKSPSRTALYINFLINLILKIKSGSLLL